MDNKSKSILQHKIKTAEEVTEIIGIFPRKNKAILCHGTFDIVHPGHIRHLLHAKTQCKTLIVSITSDNYNSKTSHFFPALIAKIHFALKNKNKTIEIWGDGTPKRELISAEFPTVKLL